MKIPLLSCLFFALIFFDIFLQSRLCAQEKGQPFNLEAKAHYGFIIPHRTGMKNLILGHVKAFELNYDLPTFGEEEWQQLYDYPTWGFSLYFADLANPGQLGTSSGIFPYINFPSVRKKKFRLNYHAGWGIGYVSKTFDRKDNYKNIIIGSKINAIISFGLESEIKLSPRLSGSAGISFTHFSNGAFTVPNLGINIPSLTSGISYLLGPPDREFRHDSLPVHKKSPEITITVSGALKSVYPAGSNKKYTALSIATTFGQVRSPKGKILPGVDLFYNTALFDYYKRAEIPVKKLSILQPGFSVNFITDISKLRMFAAMGIYIYSQYKFDGLFYHRMGTRYQFTDHLFASASVKTHFFKADFLEWGIGYKVF